MDEEPFTKKYRKFCELLHSWSVTPNQAKLLHDEIRVHTVVDLKKQLSKED